MPVRRRSWSSCPSWWCFAAAVAASFVMPKRYRSSTLILVESEKVPETFVPKMSTESMDAARADGAPGSAQPHPARAGRQGRAAVLRSVGRPPRCRTPSNRCGARSPSRRRVRTPFLIEFVHNDPEKAASVANRLASVFIEEAEGQREKQAVEGFEFIDSQLKETRASARVQGGGGPPVQGAEPREPSRAAPTNVATLQRLQMELQTVSENLRAAQARADLLRQAAQQEANNPGVRTVDVPSQLDQLRGQLAELRNRYTDQHPDVQALQRRIRELEQSPAVVVVPSSGEPEPAGGSAGRPAAAGGARAGRARARRAEVEAAGPPHRGASRQRPADRAAAGDDDPRLRPAAGILPHLLKKQMEARMAEQMERRWKGARFKILDPAHAPDRHYFPNRPLFALFGMLGGLAARPGGRLRGGDPRPLGQERGGPPGDSCRYPSARSPRSPRIELARHPRAGRLVQRPMSGAGRPMTARRDTSSTTHAAADPGRRDAGGRLHQRRVPAVQPGLRRRCLRTRTWRRAPWSAWRRSSSASYYADCTTTSRCSARSTRRCGWSSPCLPACWCCWRSTTWCPTCGSAAACSRSFSACRSLGLFFVARHVPVARRGGEAGRQRAHHRHGPHRAEDRKGDPRAVGPGGSRSPASCPATPRRWAGGS